jgi:hypothetical protein
MQLWRCAIVPDAIIANPFPIAGFHPDPYLTYYDQVPTALRYYNASYSNEWEGPIASSGVPLAEARANGWILKRNGEEIYNPTWSYNYLCNVGLVAYQEAWVRNVNALVAETGAEGVLMDDVNPRAPYQTDSGWQAKTESFLRYVVPRLRVPVYANIGWEWDTDNAARRMAALVDAVVKEHWMKWGQPGEGYSTENPGNTNGVFDIHLRYADFVASSRRPFLAMTSSAADDVQAATYGIAGLLLTEAWDGYFALSGDLKGDNLTAAHELGLRLGSPTGVRGRNPTTGLWSRTFLRGSVVVNASTVARAGLAPTSARITLS